MKIILFVDADNISESYTQRIYEKALGFGDVYEAHCFGDFVRRKEKWEQAYYQCKMQLHYIPSLDKQKGKPDPNTSDIALTAFAVQRMFECPEVDVCIVVANDKDYIPLAKFIRERLHKKAVMFYTQKNDRAILSYDEAVFLDDNVQETAEAVTVNIDEPKSEPADPSSAKQTKTSTKDVYTFDAFSILVQFLGQECSYEEEALLAELGPILKAYGINYGKKSLGKYLTEMFVRYPVLSENYELILGDKKDRIKRITK